MTPHSPAAAPHGYAGLRCAIAVAIFSLWFVSAARGGPSNAVPPAPTDDALESSPIIPQASAPAADKSAPQPAPSNTFDASRVLLALAGVVALIFLLRTATKRAFPGAAIPRATSAVKILSRTSVSPKQHLLVIQFGKRLVLVGDTGANLNPLCEITDADEIAGILARSRDESISVARRFESFFGLARKDFTDDLPQPPVGEHFDNSNEIAADHPSLDETQKELLGLREKVRDVARQIGRA
ncbi:MAG: flagellar biosynthetic protein FliO [Tepidisphaeraceae bacterium]